MAPRELNTRTQEITICICLVAFTLPSIIAANVRTANILNSNSQPFALLFIFIFIFFYFFAIFAFNRRNKLAKTFEKIRNEIQVNKRSEINIEYSAVAQLRRQERN